MLIVNCEYYYRHKNQGGLDNLEEPRIQKPDEFSIHYIVEGDGFFRINEDRFLLRHESVFVTFPEDSYSFLLPNVDVAFTYYIVTIRVDDRDSQVKELLEQEIRKKQVYYPKQHFRRVFDELTQHHTSRSPYLAEASKHMVIGVLYALLETQRDKPASVQAIEYIEKAIDWMRVHLYERASLKDMCDHLHITEAHFIRIFRANQGVPPMKYFMRLKIEAAANQLLETPSPVYEISEKFTFNSPAHFCRTFKQHMGLSPFKYRNSEIKDLKSRELMYRQRLEEAYILLQTVLDASPDLIFIKSVKGVYLGCNAAFCGFTGLSKQQIVGRSDYDIHPKEKAEFFIKHDEPVFRYNRALKNEETLVFPSGKKRLYHVYKAPFHDQAGKVIGLIGISRDINDLKKESGMASS